MKTYTTVQGDMWDSIAFSQLGSDKLASVLMRANSRYLNYYTFPAGICLNIPDAEQSTETASGLPPWKGALG